MPFPIVHFVVSQPSLFEDRQLSRGNVDLIAVAGKTVRRTSDLKQAAGARRWGHRPFSLRCGYGPKDRLGCGPSGS